MSRARNPEHALAQRILDGLNVLDIDPERVAGIVSNASPAVKLRLWKFIRQLLWLWSQEYDAGMLGPDDTSMRIQINSKKIVEFMDNNSVM